jgi:hypothetical protein
MTGHGTTSGLDLTCRQSATAHGLQPEVAKRNIGATGGNAPVPTFLFFTIFSTRWLQHDYSP